MFLAQVQVMAFMHNSWNSLPKLTMDALSVCFMDLELEWDYGFMLCIVCFV